MHSHHQSDYIGITILWSQPIAALQMMAPDGKWRWVKHIPNAVVRRTVLYITDFNVVCYKVINAGDAMEFLSGGYYKATIHRVVQPPEDQRGYGRLGLFYFTLPNDNVVLAPNRESPVLQKQAIKPRFDDADAPTMEQWRKGRASRYGTVPHEKTADGHEQDVVRGIVVKHYN